MTKHIHIQVTDIKKSYTKNNIITQFKPQDKPYHQQFNKKLLLIKYNK